MLAAFAVLVSHSYYLTTGRVEAEPLYVSTGMTLGTFAVHCFFVMSGFLVTNSLSRRQSLSSYSWARAVRIFPALIVMLVITVFGLGPIVSSSSLADYFAASQTWRYLLQNLTLVAGVAWTLPGVFETNPHPQTFNGSLWTLTYEVRLYAALAAFWVLAGLVGGARRLFWLKCFVLAGMLLTGGQILLWHFGYLAESQSARLGFMFLSGAAYQLFSARISLTGWLFTVLVLMLGVAAINQTSLLIVYLCSLPYLLLFLAYVPGGFIRHFNRLGDYSYGLYIYAFPVQQTIVYYVSGISATGLILASLFCSLALAVLSWHLIESRALRYK